MILEKVEAAALPARWDALVIHPDDDVAVALRDLAVGDTVNVRDGGAVHRITLCEAIPLGHKLARHAMSIGVGPWDAATRPARRRRRSELLLFLRGKSFVVDGT